MPDDGKRRTLGQKLGWLRENADLVQPLQDWIEIVLKDRNFAAHDEDLDFTSDAEISQIRDFANILLTYLYTLPERVRIACEATENQITESYPHIELFNFLKSVTLRA